MQTYSCLSNEYDVFHIYLSLIFMLACALFNEQNKVVHWSSENKIKLNSDKCKELRIPFARNQTEFSPVIVNGKGLEVVQHAKYYSA